MLVCLLPNGAHPQLSNCSDKELVNEFFEKDSSVRQAQVISCGGGKEGGREGEGKERGRGRREGGEGERERGKGRREGGEGERERKERGRGRREGGEGEREGGRGRRVGGEGEREVRMRYVSPVHQAQDVYWEVVVEIKE